MGLPGCLFVCLLILLPVCFLFNISFSNVAAEKYDMVTI